MSTAVVGMKILPKYRISLSFANGSSAIVDMSHRLNSLRFAALENESLFKAAVIRQDTLVWKDGETEIKITVNELLDSMQII